MGKKKGTTNETGAGKTTTKPDASGSVLPVTNPLDLWYLCQKINYALLNPITRDADGARLLQRTVTWMIRKENSWFDYHHPYIGECGYDMTSSPPQPIMSKKEPNRPSYFPLAQYEAIKTRFTYLTYGMSAADIRVSVLKALLNLNELESILSPDMRETPGALKETADGFEAMFKIQKGLFRIPDVVKIKNIMLSGKIEFQQENIDDVIEIKFNETKDTLSGEQRDAYIDIAGSRSKFHLLESNVCQIDDRRKREWLQDAKKEPMYVPVALGEQKRRNENKTRSEAGEYQHLIGAIDEELNEVRRRFTPPKPIDNAGPRLEAPMSPAEIQRLERSRAQIEMSLAAPFVAVAAAAMASVAATAAAGTTSVEVTLSSASNVIKFTNITQKATKIAVATSGTVAVTKLAAKEQERLNPQQRYTKDFLLNPTKTSQSYIFWDD
ncbi:hypothetical protein CWS43_21080 [Rahnella sp. AA]|uniref:hypothetical protein n=1 Tax=Rahnella sp. AA TaxID=2057180 RepID=UPI000C333ADA|nr:hypothetical protein [Rahnella sp. AA]PKE28527.1 hypothetical protein CWS43_21080 [Rahnella sp. AA]